jgi:hypothetical protein
MATTAFWFKVHYYHARDPASPFGAELSERLFAGPDARHRADAFVRELQALDPSHSRPFSRPTVRAVAPPTATFLPEASSPFLCGDRGRGPTHPQRPETTCATLPTAAPSTR